MLEVMVEVTSCEAEGMKLALGEGEWKLAVSMHVISLWLVSILLELYGFVPEAMPWDS